MRIVAARASLAQLRFARTVRTARGEFDERRSAIFAVDDANGFFGHGEAAPWPGFGTESVDEALAALNDTAGLLQGIEIEPGAVLLPDPVPLQGAWLGANLSIGWDFLVPNRP